MGMSKHEYVELRVADVIRETDDAVSIVFDVPDALVDDFAYEPGQFLTLRVPVNGKYRHRCYSLASAPGVDPRHKVTVKRIDGGLVSTELCGTLAAGQKLLVQPPAGHFVPSDLDRGFALFAGGSGITPVMSILKAALARGSGQVRLFYANRDDRSELTRAHPDRLSVVHWLESVQGLPDPARVAAAIAHWTNLECFMCGPEPFMASVNNALERIGVPEELVHMERFVSLPDEDEVAAADAAAGGVDAELTVAIDGETHSVAWPAGKKMLDVMLEAGIDAPYSCKVGGCSACMCRVLAGETTMAINLVLDEHELAEGWVLACQAHATSAVVTVEVP
jgi:3-ketosteroid 9alpha-monooxygenase subunit B